MKHPGELFSTLRSMALLMFVTVMAAATAACLDGPAIQACGDKACRADWYCIAGSCQASLCGNDIRDPGEVCDDGNVAPGDGCSQICQFESCGNGFRDPVEDCDDGNVVAGDGCSICRLEVCGNAVKDPGEECDDGNSVSGDGCSICSLDISLASLVVSGIASPVPLVPGTTEYLVVLPRGQLSVMLTATVSTPGETLIIAGTPVNSGVPSAPITLKPGDNIVAIVVENTFGWQRTYRLLLWAPPPCYLVDDVLNGFGEDILYIVDPNTGNLMAVGPLGAGVNQVEAIAVEPRTGVLYAADADRLGTIDVNTGEFTPLAMPFGTGQGAEGDIDFDDVDGLSFNPSTGEFYGSIRRWPGTDLLIRIDPATGAHVPDAFGTGLDYVVLDVAGKHDIDALAIDLGGVLFAIATDDDDGLPDQLVTIDMATGVGAVVGTDLGIDNVEGLGFDISGQLWGTAGDDDRKLLYRISKTTGTPIGAPVELQDNQDNQDFESIDCYIP